MRHEGSGQPDLPALQASLREAAGDVRVLGTPAPAQITAREAANWLRVSAPTAAKLLRASGHLPAGNGSFPTVAITSLAELAAPPSPTSNRPWRIVVAQPSHAWARATVASGLTLGLGLTGHSAHLLECTPDGVLRGQFGSSWPSAKLLLMPPEQSPQGLWGTVAEVPGHLAAIAHRMLVEADLVLVPYPITIRGLHATASMLQTLEEIEPLQVRRLRLLPWSHSRGPCQPPPGTADDSWALLPDLDALEAAGCAIPPLAAMPERVPPRLAMALRVSMAELTWSVVRMLT